MNNPYKTLGVSALSTKDDIKSVYRQLSKIYHPDNDKTGNQERFREINEAWEYIEKYHQGSDIRKSLKSKGSWVYKSLFNIIKEV